MADQGERTAAEREAARLERERRRVGEAPAAPPASYEPPAAPPPSFEPQPAAPEPSFVALAKIDDEAPAGTKRVRRPAGQLRLPARPRRRPAVQGPHRRRRRLLALIPLALAVALVWFLFQLFQPFHGSGHGQITVRIPAHSSSGQIGDQLAKDGVISSGFFFELRATLAGERGDLRSGTYHLRLGMSYGSALKVLTTPPPVVPTTELTLIPGKSRHQIDALLRSQGIKGSYLAATRRSRLLKPTAYGAPRRTNILEGFLFPSSYDLTKPIKLSQLVAKQLTAFKQQFRSVDMSWARRHRLTPYDVLIVASIVEDETPSQHDRPLVASVIYNRLRQGTPLQMDSTVRYAVDNYTTPISQSQLGSRSPWNTYVHMGLPPTPIDDPGMASIEAAAHPSSTNYLFFVAKPCGNGTSLFASTYARFQAEESRYNSARAKRGGRSPVNCR
jgi:UPF0755 protein